MFVRKCCWRTPLLLKLRLFPHSSSPRHTPYDNEKKKKKSWLEWEVKSRKRYVLLVNPAQEWRGGSLREKESSCWISFLPFVPCPNGESALFSLCILYWARILVNHFVFPDDSKLEMYQFSLFPPPCHQFCIICERLYCHYPAWWPLGSGSPPW